MLELVRRVLFVSLSLRGPDSLPGSRAMLVLCLIPWTAFSIAGNLLVFPRNPGLAILGVAMELTLLTSYSGLALQLAGKLERWPQTLVSLVGVQAIVTAASLPLNYLSARLDSPPVMLQAAGFALIAWWLVAMANILSQAVGRGLPAGVFLALTHFALHLATYALLFELVGVLPPA